MKIQRIDKCTIKNDLIVIFEQDEWNLYGAQPMYMNMDEDGNANAVLLLNSNAMGQ